MICNRVGVYRKSLSRFTLIAIALATFMPIFHGCRSETALSEPPPSLTPSDELGGNVEVARESKEKEGNEKDGVVRGARGRDARAHESGAADGEGGRQPADSVSSVLEQANELREQAKGDEQAQRMNDAYRKTLRAWTLANSHDPEAALIAALRSDLKRLREQLNSSGGAPAQLPNKVIRVR